VTRGRALWEVARLPRAERRRLATAVLLGAGAIGAGAALLGTSGYLISRAAQRPPVLELTMAVVAVRAFGIARAVLRYAERLVSHDLAFRTLARLRVTFYRRLAPLVPGDLRGLRTGDLLSRFVADVDALQHLYLRALAPPVVAALTVLGASVAGAIMLPAAGVAILIVLLVGATAVPALTAAAAAASGRRQARARATLTGELVEAIEGGAELAVAGRARDRVERVRTADARLARLARRDAVAGAAATGLGSLLSGSAALAVLVVGIPAVHRGALAGVLLAALAFLAMAAVEGVATLPAAARRLRSCAEAAARLAEVTDAEPSVVDPPEPRGVPGGGALELRHVRVRYGSDEPWILDGVDLRIEPGRLVALVGPSGAGKTTLAHLLVRFRDPDAGSVTLGGVDVRELAQAELRHAVVLAAQDAHLFTTTIRANVRLARPDATDPQIRAALCDAGLGAWLATLPDGLDTMVGEDGERVSGGQRQRIAVARALLADARFLILDEPVAHLDPAGVAGFFGDLHRIARGRGVLVITHARDGLEGFDAVHELAGGLLRGTADRLCGPAPDDLALLTS
jgi:thiol reductant ABC exporter CydC subunit